MLTWITEYGKKNGNGRKCRTYKVKNFTELIDLFLKKDMKGRSTMCKLVEDYANMRAAEEAEKAVEETTRETARKAFAMGLPVESVAQLVKLSGEELERIAAEVDIA